MREAGKRIGAALLCLLLALPIGGCMRMEEEEPPEESIPVPMEPEPEIEPETGPPLPERFSLPYDSDGALNPYTCPDGMQQVVGSLLYEGLFRLNTHLEPEPCLCDSWSVNESYTFYTFVLRPDVLFSDGTPLTAAAVRDALNRAGESGRYRTRLGRIARMTASGDTLTITLTAPDSGFPALLDVPVCKGEGAAPLGTGPYYFEREDTGAWLTANPLWWRGGGQPVERIFLEESQGALLYRFTSRDVQLIVAGAAGVSPAGVTGEIRYQDAPTTVLQYIVCNTARPPLGNPAFRRALNRGINRANLVSALLSGHALAAQFPVSPACSLYPADLEQSYSLSAFAEALAESGYTADRTLTLLVNGENDFKVSAAQAVAQGFAAGGVSVETRVLPWEEYQAALAEGNFDLCYSEARLTADWSLSALVAPWGALNTGGWRDNGEVVSLLEAFAAAQDRAAAMRNLCSWLREQAPILPVCFGSSSVLMHSDVVENVISTAAEPLYNLKECVIHLREPEAPEG